MKETETDKYPTRFAGKLRKADMLIGKRQTIIDKRERQTKQNGDRDKTYFDVQAIVEGDGLVRYATGAELLIRDLRKWELPARDKVIMKDWRGLFFEGSVYTLEEEEEMARKRYNITDY